MKPTIIVTDLDGTLLRSNGTLSTYTVDVMTKAIRDGCIISYATARSYISSNHVVSSIPWCYPIILYNGAMLFDPVEKKVLDGYWLDGNTTHEIIEIGRALSIVPLAFALDQADNELVFHEKLVRPGDLFFYSSRPDDPRFREMELLLCPTDSRTLILTYIGLYDELEILRQAVSKRFGAEIQVHFMKDSYIENHYFLEFSHFKANKRHGLIKWAEWMNIPLEHITVFGDNLNDLGLFEAAGMGIAVANAHEALKQLAGDVIKSNDEDGVAGYVDAMLQRG